MREKHREPEVPGEECFDGHARITSKELAITHFVKGGTLQNACSTRPRAHRQVDEQPSKRSKKNRDKSAVAMLKKYELHDRTGQPRDTRHESNHGPVVCSSSNTRQFGCVFQDMESPKLSSIFGRSQTAETNPTCKIHKSCCTSR